jgi:methylated-DNA-[protein]-cysteine S-methyltransferase
VNFAFFPTVIGRCALVWRGAVICGSALPEADQDRAWWSLQRRFPDAVEGEPTPVIADAIARVRALFDGARDDLSDIALQIEGDVVKQQVWRLTRAIPPGQTRTYGDIARDLGDVTLARAVGQALGANPCPIIVPCHRVVGAGGRGTGFSAPGGLDTKARMLSLEKARLSDAPMLFDDLPIAFVKDPKEKRP